ncbi:MAG: MFS transporter [Spirosomataceae bacterium]
MPKSRIAVSTLFFICGFIFSNWSTRLPNIQSQFLLSSSTLGLTLLCVAIGSLTSMLLTGWVIALRGSKFAAIVSTLLFSVVLTLFPLLSVTWHLAVFFYLIGFIMGAMDVAMNSQAVAVEQRFHQPMMSSFHAMFSVGMMIGALCTSYFVQYSVQTHFFIVSGGCLVTGIVCVPFLVKDAQKPEAEGIKFVLPNRAMFIIGAIAFCAMLGEGAIADWSTIYLKNVIKTDEATAPIGLSAFSAAMTLGRFGGDKLRALWGDKRLIRVNSLLAAVGLLLALLLPVAWVVIAGLLVVGAGLSTVVPIAFSSAGHNKSLPNGIGLAMVTTLGYFGLLFGPPIIGFLADAQGLRFALYFVLLLFVLMLFMGRKIEE